MTKDPPDAIFVTLHLSLRCNIISSILAFSVVNFKKEAYKNKMRQIFGFLKPYIKRMSVGFVIKVIATVAELLIPWAMAIMIDDVVPKGSIPFIFLWGLVMLAFAGISLLCNVTANRMASFVARSTTEF